MNHVEINPETIWQKVRKWPSAVLVEFALRIQAEIQARASRHRKDLPRNKNHNPEQK